MGAPTPPSARVIAVGSLLLLLTLALLITRVATVALRATGLSHEAARFQARSAFSGVGFTTAEAEDIVNHPVRRRIVLTLMLLSSAGIVTALASLLLSFAGTSGAVQAAVRLGVLIAGVLTLAALASSSWVEHRLSTVIEWALRRWASLDVRDYVRLLHITSDYSIAEIAIDASDWLEGSSLSELQLSQEGVVVLGVRHADGSYSGAPTGRLVLRTGDVVIVYGLTAALDEVQGRRVGAAGDAAHRRATTAHRHRLQLDADADEHQEVPL
jgi:hypothetical protein